jgi:hypothetical protein
MGASNGQARIGDSEWVKGKWKHGFMEFIHEVNARCITAGIEPVFGAPTSLGDWWVDGMYCEEYPRARVIYTKGDMEERIERGEGYRIVTDDPELFEMWNEAMLAVEPRLETRKSGEPA